MAQAVQSKSEHKKAVKHAYYLKNKERLNAVSKANQYKYREQKKKYAEVHKKEAWMAYKKWYANNTQLAIKRASESAMKIKSMNPSKYYAQKRKTTLKRRYSLTIEQFDDLATSQGFACAICNKIPTRTLHVDHNHKTGKVRGLLCSGCNTGIGSLKESIEFLNQAIKYLT